MRRIQKKREECTHFERGIKNDTYFCKKLRDMPQISLPFFPEDITLINSQVGFQKSGGIVYYFNGSMPIYQHPEHDIRSFRLFTSQLVVNGNAKQVEIVKAFGVSDISVKRWVKRYKEEGSQGFFYPKRKREAQS